MFNFLYLSTQSNLDLIRLNFLQGDAPWHHSTYIPAYNTLRVTPPILNQLNIFSEGFF